MSGSNVSFGGKVSVGGCLDCWCVGWDNCAIGVCSESTNRGDQRVMIPISKSMISSV